MPTDLRLRVVRGGTVPFVLRVDEGTPWTELDFELTPVGPSGGPGARVLRPLVQDGGSVRSLFEGVAPGKYRFEVRAPQETDPLVVVGDVDVRAGEATRDPRLDPLDLRGLARRIRVAVLAADGSALTGPGVVALVPDSRRGGWRVHAPAGGAAEILVPVVEATDLLVVAPGYLPAELRSVREDVRVTLAPAHPLDVTVAFPSPLPDGVHARLELLAAGDNPLARARLGGFRPIDGAADRGFFQRDGPSRELGAAVVLDASGRARFLPRVPGSYRASLRLSTADGDVASVEIVLEPPPSFAFTGTAPARAELAVPEAALERALASLGR